MPVRRSTTKRNSDSRNSWLEDEGFLLPLGRRLRRWAVDTKDTAIREAREFVEELKAADAASRSATSRGVGNGIPRALRDPNSSYKDEGIPQVAPRVFNLIDSDLNRTARIVTGEEAEAFHFPVGYTFIAGENNFDKAIELARPKIPASIDEFGAERRSGVFNLIDPIDGYVQRELMSASVNKAKRGRVEDEGKWIDLVGASPPKEAKYLGHSTITDAARQQILQAARKRGVDPYVLAASLAIESSGKIRANQYYNTHSFDEKSLEQAGVYPRELWHSYFLENDYRRNMPLNKVVKQLRKGKEVVARSSEDIENYIDLHAAFLGKFGLEKVNPKQQVLPGVKHDYVTMVNSGADALRETGIFNEDTMNPEQYKNGGAIHIDPSKRGTFTAAARKRGMGVQEFAKRVMANKEAYSPAMVKKANFARNFGGKRKGGGGLALLEEEGYDVNATGTTTMADNDFDKQDRLSRAIGLGTQIGSSILGTGLALGSVNRLQTEAPVVPIRYRRTPFRSALPEATSRLEGSYSGFIGTNPELTGAQKTLAFTRTRDSLSDLALKETSQRNRFEAQQDQLGLAADFRNAENFNREFQLRRGMRATQTAGQASAIRAGIQDMISIDAGNRLISADLKRTLLTAMKDGDSNLVARMAKELGMSKDQLIKMLGNPYMSIGI